MQENRLTLTLRRSLSLDGMTKAIHGLARGLHRAGASVTIITESAKPTWRISQYGYALRAFAARASGQSFRLGADLKQFLAEVAPDNLFLLNGIFSPQVFSVQARPSPAQYDPPMTVQRRHAGCGPCSRRPRGSLAAH